MPRSAHGGAARHGDRLRRRFLALAGIASLLAGLLATTPPAVPTAVALTTSPGLHDLDLTFYTGPIEPEVIPDPAPPTCATLAPAELDFIWGGDLPGECPADGVWMYGTGRIVAPVTGTVEFCVSSDDGMTVRIADRTFGAWWGTTLHDCSDSYASEDVGEMTMVAGLSYPLAVWYREDEFGAGLRLSWKWGGGPWRVVPAGDAFLSPGPERGLHDLDLAFYHSDITPLVTPDPEATTCATVAAARLDFAWGSGFPGSCGSTEVSMYGTGTIVAPVTGPVDFCVTSDDGMKVRIGDPSDDLTIGDWDEAGHWQWGCEDPYSEDDIGTIEMTAGASYPISVWYFQGGYGAGLRLSWKWGDRPWEVVPDLASTAPLPGLTLTVRVEDPSGAPIEGAGVLPCVYPIPDDPHGCLHRWPTDEDGLALFQVPEGAFVLRALAPDEMSVVHSSGWYRAGPGYVAEADLATAVPVTDSTSVTIVLPPARTVSGRVIAADGHDFPHGALRVAACLATILPASERKCPRTTVGADGTYRLPGISAGRYRIEVLTAQDTGVVGGWYQPAAATGYAPFIDGAAIVDVSSEDATLGDIVLPTGGRLAGVVTHPDGAVRDADIEVCPITGGAGCSQLVTDPEGRFLTGPLHTGSFIVRADARGSGGWYAQGGGAVADPAAATVLDVGTAGVRDVVIRLPRGVNDGEPETVTVRGRLDFADGGPANGAYVSFCSLDPWSDCIGDFVSEGAWSFPVPTGDYLVRLMPPNWPPEEDLSATGYYAEGADGQWTASRSAATVLTITEDRDLGLARFGAGSRLGGTIRDKASGEPLDGASALMCMVDDPAICDWATADEDGVWRTRPLPEGRYTIHYETSDERHLPGWFDATAGADGFTYRLDRASSVTSGDGPFLTDLPEGHYLSGRVLADDSGLPLTWSRVDVRCPPVNADGEGPEAAYDMDFTGWDGRYRLGPLPSDECVIRVGRSTASDYVSGYLGASGLLVESPADAAPVAIGDEDLTDVDIHVQRGVRVFGRFVDSRNGVGIDLDPTLHHPDWREVGVGDTRGSAPRGRGGRWVLRGVYPGTYTLGVDPDFSRLSAGYYDPRRAPHFSTTPVAFEVGTSDMTLPDIVIPVPGGAPLAPAAPVLPRPEITVQPVDRTSGVGTRVTFSVSSPDAGATYRWQSSSDGRTWTDVAGGTSSDLDVRVTAASLDGRRFRAVVTGAGGSVESRAARLSVAIVSRLSPAGGGIGRTVLLTGSRLGGATRVTFGGGVPSPRIVALDTSSILVSVPSGARTGAISIEFGAGRLTVPGTFAVRGKVAPTITSVAPSRISSGGTLVIRGTDLVGTSAVRVGGVSAAFTVVSASQLRLVVPRGARTGVVTVVSAGGIGRSRVTVAIR